MASCDTILEEDRDHELKVTFHPPLYLQRKIWILDVMRREGVVDVGSVLPYIFVSIVYVFRVDC